MKVIYCLAVLLVLISCNSSNGNNQSGSKIDPNIDGAGLYNRNCITCHRCDVDFTGPSLKGAESRWKDKELMYEFIRNPMAVIQKDSYAAELQKKYKIMMLPITTLSNEEIDAILAYCNDQGGQ